MSRPRVPVALMNAPLTKIAAITLVLLGAPALLAQQPQEIGHVKPNSYSTRAIAIPPFEMQGDQALQGDILSETLGNDLRLSGFFHQPTNPQFVAQTHALDVKEGKIHYAEWSRLDVSYVVKGKYTIKGDQLEAEARTYDATSGTYIFGKKYPGYSSSDPRYLAHRIANDIVQRITGWPGVAHTKMVFARDNGMVGGKNTKEIFVMDADGQNVRKITDDKSLDVTPSWGANGTEVYYTTYKDFNPDLAGIFLNGSYNWFISRFPGLNISANWSQKRGLIVLTLYKDGNSELYLLNREGKGPGGKEPKRLTFNKAIDGSPCWSPNGDQIVFTSDRGGSPQIYIMDESGVNVRQLTRQGDYNDSAVWSPRGDRIVYASRINGVFQIMSIAPTGEDLQQLTTGNASSEDPTWAPNGWAIAYTSDVTGNKQIHTMFIDGRQIDRLTKGNACYSPDWSPMLP